MFFDMTLHMLLSCDGDSPGHMYVCSHRAQQDQVQSNPHAAALAHRASHNLRHAGSGFVKVSFQVPPVDECCFRTESTSKNGRRYHFGFRTAWWGQLGLSDTTCTPADGRAARDEWVKNNGCTGTPTEWTSGNHVCYSYTCPSNYPVRWCTFNGGHTDYVNDSGSSTPWEPNETWKFFTQF